MQLYETLFENLFQKYTTHRTKKKKAHQNVIVCVAANREFLKTMQRRLREK